MEQNNYPDITYEMAFKIYTVGQNMRLYPQYLEKSPYSEPLRKSLNLIFGSKKTNTPNEKIEVSELDICKETEYLYYETKNLLNSNALDEKDKASVIKTATTQLEKLLNLLERSENINQMREFESKVLQIMKKVLPEKREEFLKEIANNDK